MIPTENMCKYIVVRLSALMIDWIFIQSTRRSLNGFQKINFEYSKIAPQNIMYDRRVVRGNTFAALVIPVSKAI